MIPANRLPTVFCSPKPTASPSAPAEHGQRGQIDADQIDADEEGDGHDRDPGQLLRQQSLRRIEPGGAAERLRGQPVGKPHGRIEDRQHDQNLDQRKQGEAASADRETDPVQHPGHRGEPADGVRQHGDKRAGGKQVGDPAAEVEAPRKAAHQQRRRDRRRKPQHQRRHSRPGIDAQRNRQHQPQDEIADQRTQPGRHPLRANHRPSSPKDRRAVDPSCRPTTQASAPAATTIAAAMPAAVRSAAPGTETPRVVESRFIRAGRVALWRRGGSWKRSEDGAWQ